MLGPTHFRLLNEEGEVSNAAAWNDPAREKLWLYHLHYFDDLAAEGAGERSEWHRMLIARWVAENPMDHGNGWEPYPLARRIVNWVKWALAGNDLPPGAAENLALQARWLRRHLEWHLLGNHLLADAKALIFAGLFFNGDEAEGWLSRGAAIFSHQLGEQVLADGGHVERSPMYHAQVLTDTLDVVTALQTYPDIQFEERKALQERCIETSERMMIWSAIMRHPDGEIALLNDAAFGEAATPGTLADYPKTVPATYFHSLKETGYIRAECGDMVAFLDTAPIGPDYLPGHAHADTLSFELSLGRQRVIVDSGVSRYGEGPERLWQRGTAAHNTVTIDGQDSSEVWGSFRVARRAYPRDLRIDEREGVVSCAHDGYRRLPGKPVHRREWRFREKGLEVHDTIDGEFREAVGRLHFHPEVRVLPCLEEDGNTGMLLLPDGRQTRWRIIKGRGSLIETTWHPEFGLSIPNRCLEINFADRETAIDLTW